MRYGQLALVVAGLLLLPGVASAHRIGASRFDAPLPLPLLFVGAGAAVGFTAVALGVSGYEIRSDEARREVAIGPRATTVLAWAARAGFLLAFVAAVVAGPFGPQVRAENLATVFVWPVWLRGVALVALLFGSPWSVLSPWRTVYEGLARLEGRDLALVGTYPNRLAEWPALAFFVAGVGVLENLTAVPRSPLLTAAVVATYALAMLVGGLAFGREWFERADALAVLYRLFGRVAPVAHVRTPDGGLRLELRTPWRGATEPVASLAAAAFVVATVYTVSFDGFTATPGYQALLFDARGLLGTGPATAVLLYVAGFLLFLAAFGLAAGAVRWLGDTAGAPSSTALALAPTVLPIAAAYELAHNYPYVARNAGQIAGILRGYLGAHAHAVDPLWWLSVPAFWWSQVALIVAGHLVAVVAAHLVTRRRAGPSLAARRTHVPMTALMVAYTVVSLWIVSRPVVA